MIQIRKQLPNIITLCNLLCGCIAVQKAFNYDTDGATLYILLAAVFDFFDGFVARKLGVSSPIGKELDSLADVVSFGLAPSVMLYCFLKTQLLPCLNTLVLSPVELLPYCAFLIAAFSAYRLAKFNLDERQTHGFLGVPTPANALLLIGLSTSHLAEQLVYGRLWAVALIALVVVPALCYLLVCEIPMFSFKSGKRWPYVFAIAAAVVSEAVALWHPYDGTGLLLSMLVYVGIGLGLHFFGKNHEPAA